MKQPANELSSETQEFKMFCTALANQSTAPNYVVVTVKNLNTGEVKEICTDAMDLWGAIYRQAGEVSCNKYPNLYFEFSTNRDLLNINFYLYTKSDLEQFAKGLDVEDIVQQIKEGRLKTKHFGNDKEQLMFSHLMFNNGIMVERDCESGYLFYYTYNEKNDK
jgi:hypothetical protein